MQGSGKFVLYLIGAALTGAALASCTLDLAGLPGSPSGATGTGGKATSTATSSGGGTSTANGGGGSGGAAPSCGNHVQEQGLGEECDDGNLALGDGCSATCTKEPLDTCPGLPITLAPPGITIDGTLAGATDNLKPGCGTNRLDVVYAVKPTTSGTLTLTLRGAYDKSVSVRSSCIDSNSSEVACGAGTGDLTLRKWVYANVEYDVVVDAAAGPFTLQLDLSACGDGVVQAPEECDSTTDQTCIGCFRCSGTGETFDLASGHCYRRVGGQQKNWKGARVDCLAWGGDLVGVSSLAENQFLKNKHYGAWTGATDVGEECMFTWVNGEPWQSHWELDEPNNAGVGEHCGAYNIDAMNDTSCEDLRDALCERAPGGGCDDGIVQPGEECDDARTYENMTCVGCSVQCPPGEIKDPGTHHCYRLVTGVDLDWNTASAECNKSGAYLATVSSPAEVTLLQPSLQSPMWIGARRTQSFHWINGDAFCYTNWLGQPSPDGNKDCVTIQSGGTWLNDDCKQKKKGYICERDN